MGGNPNKKTTAKKDFYHCSGLKSERGMRRLQENVDKKRENDFRIGRALDF
jgi:hypothetical protein